MMRGTTPTLVFSLPFDTELINKLYLTFSQNDKEILTVTEKVCDLHDTTVEVTLTQAETLLFEPNVLTEAQFRIITTTNIVTGSYPMRIAIQRILKDGEI